MITITKKLPDGLLDTVQGYEKDSWIHLSDPTSEELEMVSKQTNIPTNMLRVALDPEEFAHIDFENGVNMAVVDLPVLDKENDLYVFSTVPIGLLYNNDFFVTTCLKESSIIKDFWANRVKNVDVKNKIRFLLQIIARIEFKYLQYLKRIDQTSSAIQQELHKSIKNKELIELMDIEKSLVYFSTSLAGNDRVLFKIQKNPDFIKSDEIVDQLEDVINENKQAIEMCTIYRDILSGTMDAFASVISNNMNLVMRTLTLITITLSVPTVLASFWGMNVPVPFMENRFGFIIVMCIAVTLTTIVAITLLKTSRGVSGRKVKRRRNKK